MQALVSEQVQDIIEEQPEVETGPGINPELSVPITSDYSNLVSTEAPIIEHGYSQVVETPKTKDQELAEMAQFLNDPEQKKNAVSLAEQIEVACGSKWFTVETLVKNTGENTMSAYQKLQLCKMFDLAQFKIADASDGRKNLRKQLWKITIDSLSRIYAIGEIIAYHQRQIEDLQIKRRILEA